MARFGLEHHYLQRLRGVVRNNFKPELQSQLEYQWVTTAARPAGPARVLPEKVPAPWQGKINVHYSDNKNENMLTSIASTPPCREILY
jgi:hypothetical protein